MPVIGRGVGFEVTDWWWVAEEDGVDMMIGLGSRMGARGMKPSLAFTAVHCDNELDRLFVLVRIELPTEAIEMVGGPSMERVLNLHSTEIKCQGSALSLVEILLVQIVKAYDRHRHITAELNGVWVFYKSIFLVEDLHKRSLGAKKAAISTIVRLFLF
jgi:hypothetical protein